MARIIPASCAAVAIAIAWVPPARGDEPIPHEYFTASPAELRWEGRDRSRFDGAGSGVNGSGREPVYTSTGQTGPRAGDPETPGARNAPPPETPDVGLDRDTDMEGWLTYYTVFDPTVVPFKRVGALDHVFLERGEVRLGVADRRARPVSIVRGEPSAEAEQFWGRIVVALEPDTLVPIPSVAPSMAIHAYAADPPVPLEFFRDGADNFLVRGQSAELVRIDTLVSAPADYFEGLWPTEGRLDEIPESLRPEVPTPVRGVAEEAFAMLGLSADDPPAQWVLELAGYFRAFVAEPFPLEGRTEDIYRDILFGGRGVCRHRAFAFTVTLQAWGVPSRYVYNEAHAFSEAYLPGYGWRRVDLGGGAEGLHIMNASANVLHAPVGSDPLPTPESFLENYSARAGERPSETEVRSGESEGASEVASAESAGEDGEASWEAFGSRRLADLPQPTPGSASDGGDRRQPPAGRTRRDDRAPSVLSLTALQATAFRGEPLSVGGMLSDAQGVGLASREVVVYLGPPESQRTGRVVPLGSLTSDEEGRVDGAVDVPGSLPVGTWGVYLVFEGDEGHAPARSR